MICTHVNFVRGILTLLRVSDLDVQAKTAFVVAHKLGKRLRWKGHMLNRKFAARRGHPLAKCFKSATAR
jgi:hypothetical protein